MCEAETGDVVFDGGRGLTSLARGADVAVPYLWLLVSAETRCWVEVHTIAPAGCSDTSLWRRAGG